MKSIFQKVLSVATLIFLFSSSAFTQSAPSHLKYFGYYYVDCLYDDPLDLSTTTNYIAEVDSFSNFDLLCVSNYTTDINARVNLMNSHCVKPLLSLYDVFYVYAGTNGPSGVNYDLNPNYLSQWNTFKSINSSVLNSSQVAAFYVMDEPAWNGVTYTEYNTVCSLVKTDFPNIPIMLTEAWTMLDSIQIPTTVDWVSFDRYGIFNPTTDPTYQGFHTKLKSIRSAASQKVFLVMDDQWFPYYANTGGYTPDSIINVVQNYYNLAASDTTVAGIMAFIWPGGITTGHLGARELPQPVIDLNVQIGKMIKANNSPCSTTGIENNKQAGEMIGVYPNPVSDFLTIILPENKTEERIELYNSIGELVREIEITESTQINISDLQSGLYFVHFKNHSQQTQKFIIQ